MQYRLRYVDQVDVERRETVEAFVGRRAHETLQHFYDRLMEGVLLSHDELLAHLHNSWEQEWHDQVHIVRAEMSQDDYRQFAIRCVTNYYQSHHPFSQDGTMSTEMAVLFVLDVDRDIHIRGYIDRLSRVGDGVYEIHDYKTSRRLPSQKSVDVDRQLGFYHMAINQMVADASHIKLIWHYLAHNRRFVSQRSPDNLHRLRDSTIELIDRIDRATEKRDFPAIRTRLCDWCDYRPVCPAWNPVQETLRLQPASREG